MSQYEQGDLFAAPAKPAQAAVLLMHESPVAGAFCRLRLLPRGAAYGAFEAVIDARAILDRALPA
mgnify:CR=1 FL=1